MAKKEKAAESDAVEARVLCDFWDGERMVRADEVISLDEAPLAALKAAGVVDDHPDAVAYAKSLKA